jgi:hypothetical protein
VRRKLDGVHENEKRNSGVHGREQWRICARGCPGCSPGRGPANTVIGKRPSPVSRPTRPASSRCLSIAACPPSLAQPLRCCLPGARATAVVLPARRSALTQPSRSPNRPTCRPAAASKLSSRRPAAAPPSRSLSCARICTSSQAATTPLSKVKRVILFALV